MMFSLKSRSFLVGPEKSRRNGMAPAHAMVFLSQKPSTKNAIIQSLALLVRRTAHRRGARSSGNGGGSIHAASMHGLSGHPIPPPMRQLSLDMMLLSSNPSASQLRRAARAEASDTTHVPLALWTPSIEWERPHYDTEHSWVNRVM